MTKDDTSFAIPELLDRSITQILWVTSLASMQGLSYVNNHLDQDDGTLKSQHKD